MYNDDFDRFHENQYHYGRNSNLPADDYQPAGSVPTPEEPQHTKKPGFFRSTSAKVIAIVLACAIIGTAMPAARTPSFSSPAASLSPSR